MIKVIEENGKIYHLLKDSLKTLEIEGVINTNHRKYFMQQHTGQHIISAVLWKLAKYKTLSVHRGAEYTTIEIDTPGINNKTLIKVEEMANQIINQNLPVKVILTDPKGITDYPLRKECRVKEGDIRLVTINDLDCVACCGLHLNTTGKVGLIKAISVEKIRENIRISFKIGYQAYLDYQFKTTLFSQLKGLLNTDEKNFINKIHELNNQLIQQKRINNQYENEMAKILCRELIQSQDSSLTKIITHQFNNQSGSLIKKMAKILTENKNLYFCIINVTENKNLWYMGCSEDLKLPFDKIKEELLPLIDGKGGGRTPLFSGICNQPKNIEKFFSELNNLLTS